MPRRTRSKGASATLHTKRIYGLTPLTLDGLNDIRAAVNGAAGFKRGNYTHAELHYIATNPELLRKTTFYRDGKVVPSPF